MNIPTRTKKIVGTSAAALGLMLGAAGIASAVTAPDTSVQTAENEANEANEAEETPEQEAAEEKAELELLNSFPVTPAQAEAAALAVVPGTVDEVEIEDDGATPMFEVEIIDANGNEISVIVDPNSGAVVDQIVEGPESDDDDDVNEGPEANETNEAPEANETPAPAPAAPVVPVTP